MSRGRLPANALRRVALPVTLLVLAAALAVGGLVWLRDQRAQVAQRTVDVRGDLRDLRARLGDLRRRKEVMAHYLPVYRAARERGFLADQARLEAGETIERLAVAKGVNRVDYTFAAARRSTFAAADAGTSADGGEGGGAPAFVITPLRLDLTAQREGPVFAFIDALQAELPGHAPVRGLSLTRAVDDLDGILDDIRRGRHPAVIQAQITLDWVTLALPPPATDSGDSPDA